MCSIPTRRSKCSEIDGQGQPNDLPTVAFARLRRWLRSPDDATIAFDRAIPVRRRFGACKLLIECARFDEADAALQQLESTEVSADAKRYRFLCRQMKRSHIAESLEYYAPKDIVAPAKAGSRAIEAGSSEGAFLLRGDLSKSKKILIVFVPTRANFWISASIIHRGLKEEGHHLVFLKSRLYMTGVEGLGTSYRETVAALRQMAVTLGTTEVYSIGWSAGCYAAVRYGLDLHARGVLCFGPAFIGQRSLFRCYRSPTGLGKLVAKPSKVMHKAARAFNTRRRNFFEDVVERLTRRRLPRLALVKAAKNLRVLLARAQQPPQVILVYGDKCKDDTKNCLQLAGIQGVTLYPLLGSDRHDALSVAISTGEFQPLIAALLSI